MLSDKYKVQVSFVSIGLRDTSPVNQTMEWTFEREEGEVFYRTRLSSPLIFKDDPAGEHDFTKLYTQERGRIHRCDKADVIIFKRCTKTGAWVQHWNGYLSMIDGKWDVDKCEVEIVPRIQDQYSCLFENWEKNISLLALNIERQTARSTIGVIEYKECIREDQYLSASYPAYFSPGCMQQSDQQTKGWTLVYWKVIEGSYVRTTWAREVVTGENPGNGWVNDGGVWVRNVEVIENDTNFNNNDPGVFERQWTIIQYTLKNGLKLNDVLQEMVKALGTCGYKLTSIFFDINKSGTRPTNRAYSKAFDHARTLQIYEKTDVKSWNSDQAAQDTLERSPLSISWKRMYENLKALFNLGFIIDKETKTIRIEHISYFEDRRMLDLTQDRYLTDIKGRWRYSYDKEQLPTKEIFKFMESNLYDFDGLPINYESVCSNDNKATNETTILADYVSVNVDSMAYVPGQTVGNKAGLVTKNDSYTNEGMVLVEVSPTGYIVSGRSELNGSVKRNMNLSWPNLQDYYHRHKRPQSQGYMNNRLTNFETFKRTRKQEAIQIQLCCSDFENFYPIDLVKTQLGWGQITTAKYTEPQEILTLETIHD